MSFVTFHCQRPFAMKVRLTIQRKTSNTQKIKSTNHACEILGEKVGFFFQKEIPPGIGRRLKLLM